MTWTIAAATERLQLNPQRQGELTFTVTNPGPTDLRAVMDVLPGETASATWFVVDAPQRVIAHGSSATFLVRVAVPPNVPPGPYWLAGRVYSADGAPEETSAVSNRVVFEVAAAAARRPNPLVWIIPAVVLVLLVAGVVGWLLLRDPGPPDDVALTTTAPPPTTTTTVAPSVMVDLAGMPVDQARATVEGLGATVGTVRRRHDPPNKGTVLAQSVPNGTVLTPGTPVDLEVAIALTPAALVAPSNGAGFAPNQGLPTVSWQAVPDAAGYRVQFESELCGYIIFGIAPCIYSSNGVWGPPYADYHARSTMDVTGTSATPDFAQRIHDGVPRAGHSGGVRWQVFAIDDFGNLGPSSGNFAFHKALRNPDEYGPLPG